VNITGWLKGLRVTADGTGIVSHAGGGQPDDRSGELVLHSRPRRCATGGWSRCPCDPAEENSRSPGERRRAATV